MTGGFAVSRPYLLASDIGRNPPRLVFAEVILLPGGSFYQIENSRPKS
jgi:hypothetical protein